MMFIIVVFSGLGIFFFKQKTAYEMRISDWSSDVCSSDLPSPFNFAAVSTASKVKWEGYHRSEYIALVKRTRGTETSQHPEERTSTETPVVVASEPRPGQCLQFKRSEEHTSELQSLMRISYAVFCLKKKKH